ncbi:hypothetical protein [Bacillus massiliigorillae]|uniref:hypothetical protein n=1 Tax=Bacillus massiliigorillae TaxID=1243664 RepID=UPI00039EC2F5|nr:hypothetical protein [Bacillus massiliigorillae]
MAFYQKGIESNLDKRFMKHSRTKLYVMLEDVEIDWYWDEKDVKEFDKSFKRGMNVEELANKFNRSLEEIALMVIDRSLRA